MDRAIPENYMVSVRAKRGPKRLRRIKLFAVLVKIDDSQPLCAFDYSAARTRLPGKDSE